MARSVVLEEILRLDPVSDHQRIVYLSTCFDFPFDTTRALEFALFRTFCVPNVSSLLDQTGEFGNRAQKRYDDTDIIVSELMEWGYDSDRGTRALRRMNQLHGRFTIANDDFLYVLSTFIFEPIRWNARFGWRTMCENERQAYFLFWREIGRRMNIRRIPEQYAELEAFNVEFEARHFRHTESNARIGSATRELFASWFPRPLAPLVRLVIHSLLDEPVLAAFGFPRPSKFWHWLAPTALRLRGSAVGWLPARRKPRLRTSMIRRSYPLGYTIERLGPDRSDLPPGAGLSSDTTPRTEQSDQR